MNDTLVRFIGRVDARDPAGPRFEWAGTAIVARFSGTGISIRLRGTPNDLSQPNQFQVVVDAEESRLRLRDDVERYELARGLPDGEHTVTVTRRTEALFGSVQFLGFEVHAGTLLPLPPDSARRHIELIGDSITNGYGNEGPDAATPFSAETENEGAAFGALTAAALGATHTAIAWSGRGLRVNYGDADQPTVPQLFERNQPSDAAQPWSFVAERMPDAVVIYLGTNDTWSAPDPGEAFTTDYVSFLERVRAVYPAAHIFVAAAPERPFVVARAGAAITRREAAGDTAVHAVVFDAYDAAHGKGCDHHPSAAAHRAMAKTLTAAIRATLGW